MANSRPHSKTAVFLFVICAVCAMVFFSVVRVLGGVWFLVETLDYELPLIVENIVLSITLAINYVMALKTLTDIKWTHSIIVSLIMSCTMFLSFSSVISIYIDLIVYIVMPIIITKNIRYCLPVAIIYTAFICLYQLLMIIGRNYPAHGKYNAIWQLISTLDYYMVIIAIFIAKEVIIDVCKRTKARTAKWAKTRMSFFLGKIRRLYAKDR